MNVLESIKAHLTPEGAEAIRALASTAVALDTTSADPEALALALVAHTSVSQTLSNNIAHIHALQTCLDKQQLLLRAQLGQLQSDPAFSTPPSLQRHTTEQARQAKHLRAKIREYEDRLASLKHVQARNAAATPASKSISSADAIADMLEQQTALTALRDKVEAFEACVAEYAGLPADRDMARKEVSKLEIDLDNLRRKRDGLFEGLVG